MSRNLILLIMFVFATAAQAATVAYWDFEDGAAGQPFNPASEANGSTGSVDTVADTLMRGWSESDGPWFTSAVHSNGGSLAMNLANNQQDGYVTEGVLHSWSPTTWTIECQVYLEEIAGWETMIGRDGTTVGAPESDFYLSNNGIDDRFRINIMTVGGQRWILDGDYTVELNHWYGLAAMSDGETLELWLDDGTGYAQIGTMDISDQSVSDNALPGSTLTWTFGRGWYNGSNVDHIAGKMDNVRFSDTVLTPGQLLPVPFQPYTAPVIPDLGDVTNEFIHIMCYHEGYYPDGGNSGVFLSWSTNGTDFYRMNHGHPVFVPPEFPGDDADNSDGYENLVRDPSIIYDASNSMYRLVFTSDINSRSFGYAESPDLVHWQNVKLVQIWDIWDAEPGNVLTSVDHTWAPEWFYNEDTGDYMIIFSSGVNGASLRMWYTETSDFDTFSVPEELFDNGGITVIDGCVRKVGTDHYILAYKNEAAGNQTWIRNGTTPYGPWTDGRQASAGGDEGPCLTKFGDTWHLYWDNFGNGDNVFGLATSADTTNWTDITWMTDMPKKADVPDYGYDGGPPHHGTVFEAPLSSLGTFLTEPLQDNLTNLTYMVHRWSFDEAAGPVTDGTTVTDSVSSAVAVVNGNRASYTGAGLQLPGDTSGTGDAAYLDLPNGIVSSLTNMTIEIWATPTSSRNWQRLFSFGRTDEAGDGGGEWTGPAAGGTSARNAIYWTLNVGTDVGRQHCVMRDDTDIYKEAVSGTTMETATGTQYHYVFTFVDGIGFFGSSGGRFAFYRDGIQIGWRDVPFRLQDLEDVNNWLGRSQWSADSNSHVEYNEVRVYSEALSWTDIYGHYLAGPDVVVNSNPGLRLDIGSGSGVLTWPGNVVGLSLESTETLELSNTWAKVTNTVENTTNGLQVVMPLSSDNASFRLAD